MQVDLLQTIRKLMATHDLQLTLVTPPFEGLENFDYGLRNALDPVFDWQDFGRILVDSVPENTLLFTEDGLNCTMPCSVCRIPGTRCVIGPWTMGQRSQAQIDYTERIMGKQASTAVQEYYNGVRSIDAAWLAPTISTLVSMAFPEDDFRVQEMREFLPMNFSPDTRYFNEPAFEQELPASMLEQRYAAEGRLLEAVSRGDTEAALQAMNGMGRFRIQGRLSDTPYQVKTLLTVMNTLFRKAIERSMVHPYYIDEISTRYARRIENASMEEQPAIIGSMVREYCAYVRKYSLKEYSPLVQKIINHINLNLSSELSLKSLAAMCYISPSYLSNLFKRETGTTLIDYINTQRVQRAAHLLATTKLSVASVAERVGILDVNYFAKLFKKALGQTPTQYRRNHPQPR